MRCYPFIHSDGPDCAEVNDDLRLVCTHDCPPQPLEWLWPEKIPLGKVTLLIGDPGTGKSLVALDIAARASRGANWPGDPSTDLPPSALRLPPSSTILLSASDDLADTIRPRLDAAGADPRRVFVIPSIADLRDDFNQLRAAVNRAPNCRLIIIDPINAYVGPGDAHFQTVVRKVLAPLAELARDKRIAVIAVAHLRKTEGAAIHRAAGSMGFVAASRAVWSVSRDPENPSRHLLLPVKINVAPAACGLAYTVQQTGPLAAPALVWDLAPLAAKAEPKRPAPPSAERIEAREWLRHALADGPRPASKVIDEGQRRGFLRRTLQRAFHELDGHTAKRGLQQGWWWSLADQTAENAGDCPNFAQSSEQNGTVPFPEAQHTADIFEDVTYENDIAAQQQLDELLKLPPPLSNAIATLDRTGRQRRDHQHQIAQNRLGRAGHHHGDSGANSSEQNIPVPFSAELRSNAPPPSATGHPILDAILDELRNKSPITSPPRRVACGNLDHTTPNTS